MEQKIKDVVERWQGLDESERLYLTATTLVDLWLFGTGQRTAEQLGSFCRAVVKNDLLRATTYADATNKKVLAEIVHFFNFIVPGK